MTPRREIDVSGLPTVVFAPRDPVFWGALGLIAIEGTVFVLCAASYLYVRGNFVPFPPTPPGRAVIAAGTLELALLAASCGPNHVVNRAAEAEDLRGMRRSVVALLVLQLAALAVRAWQLHALPFRWDTHAYGSIFWLTLGLHTMHLFLGVVEGAFMLALLLLGPVEHKHRVDIHTTGIYWYFVVASWLPLWALLYLDPWLLARGGAP